MNDHKGRGRWLTQQRGEREREMEKEKKKKTTEKEIIQTKGERGEKREGKRDHSRSTKRGERGHRTKKRERRESERRPTAVLWASPNIATAAADSRSSDFSRTAAASAFGSFARAFCMYACMHESAAKVKEAEEGGIALTFTTGDPSFSFVVGFGVSRAWLMMHRLR